jgi:pilus assembly protein CpaE
MSKAILVYNVEIERDALPNFALNSVRSRKDLITGLSAMNIAALILDLDAPDAIETILSVLEVRPQTGIVGVTGSNDLNRVIEANRAGCRQVTTRPLDPADLDAAIRRVLNEPAEINRSKVFAVVGSAGGVGTTTVACHLAAEVAHASAARTLLVDLDFDFGGVARAFDAAPRFTIADLTSAGTVDNVLLEKAAIESKAGVAVIARPASIEEGHNISDASIRATIKAAARQYKYVVIDLPRKLDAVTGCAIEVCDRLLLVLQTTVPSIDNAKRLVRALSEGGIPSSRIELVVNRYRKSVHSCTIELVESELGKPALATIPSDYQTVVQAIDFGKPLPAKNPVRIAIAKLAAALTGIQDEEDGGGWFRGRGAKRKAVASG